MFFLRRHDERATGLGKMTRRDDDKIEGWLVNVVERNEPENRRKINIFKTEEL